MGTLVELTAEEFARITPPDAVAAIVAGYDVDESNPQVDHFYVSGVFSVVIWFSSSTRDMFHEMRKAAAKFPRTEHLGPGRGLFRVRAFLTTDVKDSGHALWAGQYSPFHHAHEPGGNGHAHPFTSRAAAEEFIAGSAPLPAINVGGQEARAELRIEEESIEHREKYSMGRGYYLKAGCCSGWRVFKEPLPLHEPRFIVAGYLVPDGIGHPAPAPIEAVAEAPCGRLAEAASAV